MLEATVLSQNDAQSTCRVRLVDLWSRKTLGRYECPLSGSKICKHKWQLRAESANCPISHESLLGHRRLTKHSKVGTMENIDVGSMTALGKDGRR